MAHMQGACPTPLNPCAPPTSPHTPRVPGAHVHENWAPWACVQESVYEGLLGLLGLEVGWDSG